MPAKKISTFNSDGTNQRATVIVGLGFRGSDGELYVVDGDQTNGGINVNSTFAPAGTQDVNVTKIAGTAVEVGQGASSAGSQRVVANLSVSGAAATLANPVAVTPGTGATFQSAQSGVWATQTLDGSGNAIGSSVTTLGRSIFAQGLVAGIEANAGTVDYTNSISNSISTYPGAYNAGGSITTSGDVVSLTAAVNTLNPGIVGITVKSGSGGIMQPEISTDGTTWYSVRVYRIDGTPGSVSTITANGVYQANIAGVRYFRINCTSTPSVAYVVNIRSSPNAFSNNTEITGAVPLPTGAATDTTLTGGTVKTQIYNPNSTKSVEVDLIGGIKQSFVTRVFGDGFANGIGGGSDAGTFPTSATLAGAATGNVTNGFLQLRTGSSANGNSAVLQSLRTLSQRSGTLQAFHSNVSTPAGYTSFRVVARNNSVDTAVDSGVFSGTSTMRPDGNFHRTEMRFSGAGSAQFVVNDTTLHSLSGTVTTPRVNVLDLPLRFEVSTTAGVTTMRWGMFTTVYGYFYEANYAAADLILGVRTTTAQQMGANVNNQTDAAVSNAITANGVSIVAPINNSSTTAIQITGTFVATLAFEATVDGANYVAVAAIPVGGGAAVSSVTAPGTWRFGSAGYSSIRARSTAYTSGTAQVNINTTQASGVGTTFSFGTGATDGTTQRTAANIALAGVAAATGTGASGTGTQRVQLATESLPGVGSASVQLVSATQRSYIIDMASTNMTTTYLQIISSTPGVINSIEVFNGSGEPMFFATGAAASEVSQYVIPPGGTTGFVKLSVAAATRLAVKSFANTVNSGYFILNTLS